MLISSLESDIESLEQEMEEDKQYREICSKSFESADGYWQREDSSRKLSNANSDLSFTMTRIRFRKQDLAKAKTKLESLENEVEQLPAEKVGESLPTEGQ